MIFGTQTLCDHIVGDPPVTYQIGLCPRCRGVGTYNGINFTSSGRVQRLNGFASLQLEIRKILITQKRPTGYGFDYSLLQSGHFSGGTTPDAVAAEVNRCLNYLISLQQAAKAQGFQYLPTEELLRIDSVTVTQG